MREYREIILSAQGFVNFNYIIIFLICFINTNKLLSYHGTIIYWTPVFLRPTIIQEKSHWKHNFLFWTNKLFLYVINLIYFQSPQSLEHKDSNYKSSNQCISWFIKLCKVRYTLTYAFKKKKKNMLLSQNKQQVSVNKSRPIRSSWS